MKELNTYSPMSTLLTIVSQAPLGYIMVVYFDSKAFLQHFQKTRYGLDFQQSHLHELCIFWSVSLYLWVFALFMFCPVSQQVKKAHSLLPQYILKRSQVNINVTYGQGKLTRCSGEIGHNISPVNIQPVPFYGFSAQYYRNTWEKNQK